MFLLFALLAGCIDLESVGAYSCDEYCEQVLAKTETCAEESATAACEASGSACGELTEEQLAAYAAEGRDDWAGASRAAMIDSCNADIEEVGKQDAACQAETATINNLSCEQILDLLGQIADAAQ